MSITPDTTSIQLLKRELEKLGYTHKPFVLGEAHYTQFKSPGGNIWLTSNNRISYPFSTSAVGAISRNKNLSYELATQLGATIPITAEVSKNKISPQRLQTLLQHAPLIVKPNDSSLSYGLTLNIHTEDELIKAIVYATTFSETVLVQQQLSGEEIRFVALNGKITAALLRQTPRVIGDGVSTLKELLAGENRSRAKLSLPYLDYPQLDESLIDFKGLDLQNVPQKDSVVELGRSTMIRGGASVYNVLEDVHPSYLETVQRLVAEVGQGFIVADIFIDDYHKPQSASNYAFIEFNMAPVLKLFYSCRDLKQYDVLRELVPMIDQALSGAKS